MTENTIQPILAQLAERHNLTTDQATRAFQIIMNGGATPAQMAALMMGLRMKGETVEELTAAATVMRVKAQKISCPEGAIDVCGTGGDAKGTVNISTATALVVAACGVPVVKHGGRAVSSSSGSADVLSELQVKVDADVTVAERALRDANIAFLFAPRYHTAMRHVAPIRQELAMRTIFNLLGPLSNPAAPPYQLLGVYSDAWVEPLAHVLHKLGAKRAWVVHGSDGLDELTITGSSTVAELNDGTVRLFEITPEDAGLPRGTLDGLKGGDAKVNAVKLREAISGLKGPYRDAVILNAAAALLIAGKATDLKAGATLAAETIDAGKAFDTLQKLVLSSRT